MLDMNAPYDIDECIAFARAVEPSNIFWLEEPLHWYLQPADFVRLAQATPIPLAHGERELTRFTVRDFIANGAIRYVQFDSTRYAGFTEALRVAQLAEQHGVMIAPHTVPELHGHLVTAFPRCGFAVESHGNAQRDPVSHGLYREHVDMPGQLRPPQRQARFRGRDRLGIRQALPRLTNRKGRSVSRSGDRQPRPYRGSETDREHCHAAPGVSPCLLPSTDGLAATVYHS